MSKLLYIESSPRKKRSHSIAVAQEFLAAYQTARPGDEIETLDLWKEKLPAFDGAMLEAKYAVLGGEKQTDEQAGAWAHVTALAEQFKSADKVLISAPMWNFSIPYRLKHYIDIITQPGLTWSYTPEEGYSGLCKGRTAALICASGDSYAQGTGFEAFDMQKPYLQSWLTFLGISVADIIEIDSTLFPQRMDDTDAKRRARALAARF